MQGKRVLITGGNSGIGLIAARKLAAAGAEVILACRDSDKTRQALEVIGAGAEIAPVNLPVDLASLASVRELAATFLARYDRLDVLINNAGIMPAEQVITEDGFEMQMAVNHLSHFLLTHLLLDCLKASAPARIVNVSSMMHKKGEMDLATFTGFHKYKMQAAYSQSKLANMMFTVELAERLNGSGVTVNALHPGAVATDIVRSFPWLVRKIVGLLFISPEKGAKTTMMLASDPELEGVSGKYYDQCKLAGYSPVADDNLQRDAFWAASTKAVGL